MTNCPIKVDTGVWLNPSHVAQVRVKEVMVGDQRHKVLWLTNTGKNGVVYSMVCDTEFEAKAVVADYRAAVAEAESRGV